MISFLFALTFSILPILFFVIPGLFLFVRWFDRRFKFQHKKYESTYFLFHKRRPRKYSICVHYVRCRCYIRRNTLCRMVLQLSLQWRSYALAGLFGGSYWYCLSITSTRFPHHISVSFKQPSMEFYLFCFFYNHLTTSICSVTSSFVSRGFHFP